MNSSSKQSVGVIGTGALAATVVKQLATSCTVVAFDPLGGAELAGAGAQAAGSAAAVAQRAGIVFLADETAQGLRAKVLADPEFLGSLAKGVVIVDLAICDPAEAQSRAKALAERGVSLVDAPIHCERLDRYPEGAAILCGGSTEAVAVAQPWLERICPKVVICGEAGSGHAARAVVAAIAVCNRLITYECAAMGLKNGLTVSDMATVLNRCSGYNSASARVLPALTAGERTADAKLDAVANELAISSLLARRLGAPTLLANLALSQVMGGSRSLGPDADLDDLVRLVEEASDASLRA